ncbi:hypothetical protein [Amylibacter sp. SFDW26]|nr:hypothetical protein [Amylibacter sp. SFDW26]
MNTKTKLAINIALMICADQIPFIDAEMVEFIMLLLDLLYPKSDRK